MFHREDALSLENYAQDKIDALSHLLLNQSLPSSTLARLDDHDLEFLHLHCLGRLNFDSVMNVG